MIKKDIISEFIKSFSKIPGMGIRSSKRMVYHLLLNKNKEDLNHLIEKLTYLRDNARNCIDCHAICFDTKCNICNSDSRQRSILCIVEKSQHIETIENAGGYNGLYHVIGGVLSVFDGITADHLNINTLKSRIEDNNIKEVIFALPPSQDGYTTIHYITDILSNIPLKITMPAQGIPIGSDMDYLDSATLTTAFAERKAIYS